MSSSSARTAEDTEREAIRARQDRKAARYALRTTLWDMTTLDACRGCGRNGITEGGRVGLRVGSGGTGSGFSGLATCGSVWACPVCAAKIAARRADDLGRVLGWAAEQGHTVAMLTLTARHRRGHRLAECWDAVQGSWAAVTSGRAWQAARDRWGVLGWARAVEVTHGDNGWHVHLHVVLVLDGSQTQECVQLLGEALWPRWYRALRRRRFSALRGPGLDIRMGSGEGVDGLAAYLTKSLAAEATMGATKQGRGGSRTPFQILGDVQRLGDADDLDRWHEWETASRGRRQMTWSRDLRAMAGLADDEPSDEQIAAEDAEGEDVLVFEPEDWRQIAREQGLLLLAADRFGVAGARAWLRGRGIGWSEVSVPVGKKNARGERPAIGVGAGGPPGLG